MAEKMSNAAERRAARRRSLEANTLAAGVELLEPLLKQAGFSYRSGDSAASSGGSFSNGFFVRDEIELAVIVRSECRMGVPNYTTGHGYASHHRVLAALGVERESMLIQPDHFSYSAKNGGDAFLALYEDLRDLVIPVLERSEDDFRAAINTAAKEFRDRLRGKNNG
jgi:hypothetical protein